MTLPRPVARQVVVTADTAELSEKPDDYFTQFSIVVLTAAPLHEMMRINRICRAAGTCLDWLRA